MQLTPLPIFSDNYIWLAQVGSYVLAVDPGDADPLIDYLAQHTLQLSAILITHRHNDHIGGLPRLAQYGMQPVYGPAGVAGVSHPVQDGDVIRLTNMDLTFEVLHIPGHTPEHLAYVGQGALFCGDTIFACGCGRLTAGSAAAMQQSLARLTTLPGETLVCCTHEYTLANQRFARAVEPDNVELLARCQRDEATRDAGRPTLPSSLADELATNPMLRWSSPTVIAAARAHGAQSDSAVDVFSAIRRWKDDFK